MPCCKGCLLGRLASGRESRRAGRAHFRVQSPVVGARSARSSSDFLAIWLTRISSKGLHFGKPCCCSSSSKPSLFLFGPKSQHHGFIVVQASAQARVGSCFHRVALRSIGGQGQAQSRTRRFRTRAADRVCRLDRTAELALRAIGSHTPRAGDTATAEPGERDEVGRHHARRLRPAVPPQPLASRSGPSTQERHQLSACKFNTTCQSPL